MLAHAGRAHREIGLMLASDLPDEAVATSPGFPHATGTAEEAVVNKGVHVWFVTNRRTLVVHGTL